MKNNTSKMLKKFWDYIAWRNLNFLMMFVFRKRTRYLIYIFLCKIKIDNTYRDTEEICIKHVFLFFFFAFLIICKKYK